jgi:hypothetical protein
MNFTWDDKQQILFINVSTKNLFLLINEMHSFVEQYK